MCSAAAKIWLTFKNKVAKGEDATGYASGLKWLEDRIREEYSLLEDRLSQPGQDYIALGDRPTLPDYAYWPFANRNIAASAGISFDSYPKLEAWSQRIQAREACQSAWEKLKSCT